MTASEDVVYLMWRMDVRIFILYRFLGFFFRFLRIFWLSYREALASIQFCRNCWLVDWVFCFFLRLLAGLKQLFFRSPTR